MKAKYLIAVLGLALVGVGCHLNDENDHAVYQEDRDFSLITTNYSRVGTPTGREDVPDRTPTPTESAPVTEPEEK